METASKLSDFGASALQWEALKSRIAGRSQSPLGRSVVQALTPSFDLSWIEMQQGRTAEMRMLLQSGVPLNFQGAFNVDDLLAKARIPGAVLEIQDLQRLIEHAETVDSWRKLVFAPGEFSNVTLPGLHELSRPLLEHNLEAMLKGLRGKIEPDGTLCDDASPELNRIRRALGRQHQAIEANLKRAFQHLSEEGVLQEALISIRGDRFVIPIKAEAKRRVPGVVHGSSSSGQTVFIEPMETIEGNNELARLLQEEQAEVYRILLAMTRAVGLQAAALQLGAEILAQADAHSAIARFANDFACVRPLFRTETELQLSSDVEGIDFTSRANEGEGDAEFEILLARHPLLQMRLEEQGGEIVPLTLALPNGKRQMIISGPNTGGKTVALKTAGLLVAMAQAGMPVSASSARLPLFTAIYADIGDMQSLETNLSTFSAHVINLDRISRSADDRSLVLLDELGSATDPEEGAALAVAIAERFLALRSWCIITTHLTSLKIHAAKNDGVMNAAVGFDEATLTPTYDLRLGVPGASAGLNIASRLGMAPDIIFNARAQMSSQQVDIGRFLDELHAQLTSAARERAENQELATKLHREREYVQQEGRKEQQARTRELERQLGNLIKAFDEQLQETMKAVEDKKIAQKVAKDGALRLARLRREFSEQFQSKIAELGVTASTQSKSRSPVRDREPRAGDLVTLRSLKREGMVTRVNDDQTLEVNFGTMKMRVAQSDIAELTPVHETSSTQTSRLGYSLSESATSEYLRPEINVVGKRLDEAEADVDRFVERAFLAGLPKVRVVHGVGMGVLRRALREFLRKHPHVVGVDEPAQNEGGQGVTVVSLRQ